MHWCFRQSLDGNKPVVSEEMSFENVNRRRTPDAGRTDGRTPDAGRTMDDGRRAITKAHPEHTVCSGELKRWKTAAPTYVIFSRLPFWKYLNMGLRSACTTSTNQFPASGRSDETFVNKQTSPVPLDCIIIAHLSEIIMYNKMSYREMKWKILFIWYNIYRKYF